MVYVEVDFIDSTDWVLLLLVVDSSVFKFHGSFSFHESQSKQGVQEETGEYERTQQVQ